MVLSAWTDIAYDDNGNRLSELTSHNYDDNGNRLSELPPSESWTARGLEPGPPPTAMTGSTG